MDETWQARLRRLGVQKGARHLKSPSPRPFSPPAQPDSPDDISFRPPTSDEADDPPRLTELLPGGQVVETAVGACFVVDRVYPLSYRHGSEQLGDLLGQLPATLAPFLRDERLRALRFEQCLFLDTETTGLAGAGVLAFMVGVAFFDAQSVVVRQFFLRDHGDEAAMLTLLDELLAARPALVTFNGRSFDLPLLDGRYLMNRMPGDLLERPHLDLLLPARRLWRLRLGSCALSSLEQTLLDVTRTHEDVPGWAIPGLYQAYLRSGDARELLRVFYHNQIDMLSMVTLATRMLRLLGQQEAEAHPVDLVSLGRWQSDLGMLAEAEQALRLAAAADLPLDVYRQALTWLGLLLKRQARRDEALPIWQQLAATSYDSIDAHVELAMHHEWQTQDLAAARRWTEAALTLVAGWPSAQAEAVRPALLHRLQRLQRKQAGA
ncbi:MAG: ribonuclease H-like domain-containing protein [Anaerolineales bacterium]|nr:ribonuclease H-like domain-containing protein [Anaerolineales bacterium]